jgi:hypothetical protein
LIPALKRWEGGGVSVKARNADIVHIHAAPNELVIDLQHIAIVNDILDPFRQWGVLNLVDEAGHEASIVHQLMVMKGFEEALTEAQLTIRIRRRGETVLVMGERANPRLSKVILGNKVQADILQLTALLRDLRQ